MQRILIVELSCTSRLVLAHLEARLFDFGSLQAGSLRAEQLHLLCQLSSLCFFTLPAHTSKRLTLSPNAPDLMSKCDSQVLAGAITGLLGLLHSWF